ncbi:MAG: hypothetical protein JXA92_08180 [candidate division Zixibacteria bacterium]|nr:hypothetical protein [candidate division Zixibacteria bacterium]
MRFVYSPVAMLIIVMIAFGVDLAAADNPGRENASRRLSNHTAMVSVADNRQDEPGDQINSPPAEKSDTVETLSGRIFGHPEFYYVPCRDYRQVLTRCLDNWRAARSEFTKNRSWTYGFDKARKRGYRLARERECCEERRLRMYLEEPLIPHPKYERYRPPVVYRLPRY